MSLATKSNKDIPLGKINPDEIISGKKYNRYLYTFIRDNGGWTNFIINPIKTFPCDNKMQKLIEERRIMHELGAELNTRTPYKMIN